VEGALLRLADHDLRPVQGQTRFLADVVVRRASRFLRHTLPRPDLPAGLPAGTEVGGTLASVSRDKQRWAPASAMRPKQGSGRLSLRLLPCVPGTGDRGRRR